MNPVWAFAPLAIVPVACAPAQLLLMKYGRRYDLGCVMLISVGAMGSASAAAESAATREVLGSVMWVMLAVAVSSAALRWTVLAFGDELAFTLMSLAQFWATPPLLAFLLRPYRDTTITYLNPTLSPFLAVAAATLFSAVILVLTTQFRVQARLEAMTNSKELHGVLIGSPFALAFVIEAITSICYIAAGCLLGLVIRDVTADRFNPEAIWALLAVAPALHPTAIDYHKRMGWMRRVVRAIPVASLLWVLALPLAIPLLRMVVTNSVPAAWVTTLTYGALSVVLFVVAARGLQQRVSRA